MSETKKTDIHLAIGRETGSGGREIGSKVAEILGVPYYDKELLTRASKESGIDERIITSRDEKPTSSLIYSLAMGSYPASCNQSSYQDLPLDHKIFLAQFDAIRKIAEEGPCVIVGRCADYALEDDPHLLSVFISGEEEDRIRHVAHLENITYDKAKDVVKKTDKRRSSFYDYYSNKRWGKIHTYDMCLDSSVFGIDGCVDLILKAIETKERK